MNKFDLKTHIKIKNYYFNKGLSQKEIAIKFNCNKSSISRIINDLYVPYDILLKEKEIKVRANFMPEQEEPKQAITLRNKREKLHSTKLNEKIIKKIRHEYFSGIKTQKELATEYKVHQSTISRILTGKKWKIRK